jgi:hypothetical protein
MSTSLLDFILNLLRDGDAKAAFVANPDHALAAAGLSDVCSEDVSDAMSQLAEYHPVSFRGDREHHEGDRDDSQHARHYQPEGHRHEGEHHSDGHASAVQQLEYITNNYSYADSHDTMIDKSVNQEIWNKGTLSQRFDDHSVTATDHSVAAGRDIDGNVANGDHNVVGDGNSVGNTSYRDDHSDNHSVHGSFNGNNVADHGGVAGRGNTGNVTNPDHSNVATNHSDLDASRHDSHNSTIQGSFNDSHNDDSRHITTVDSNNDESHHSTTTDSHNHQSFNENSFNHEVNNHESYNQDSAITSTHQDGLINANVSPAVALPVHDNELDVLSHNHG